MSEIYIVNAGVGRVGTKRFLSGPENVCPPRGGSTQKDIGVWMSDTIFNVVTEHPRTSFVFDESL